ncbi:MAG: hypothetical protein JWL70_784 [Acidimicrobiia bacterium]|nr:hypothetical protein [Acidimicrobiia bacterium]
MIDPSALAANVARVQERIAAAGGRDVTVMAVTKGFGADAIAAARGAGLADLGESYAQELLERRSALAGARVHFIGRLQSNKVRSMASLVSVWQSVDRAGIAAEVARRAPGAQVMVQVNVSDEATKGGCAPADTVGLVSQCRDLGLAVQGLMAVGSSAGPDAARAGFALLRSQVDDLGLEQCSMGMSGDLEIAVQEGATMVRIGSALFGPRPLRRVLSE